MAEEAKKHPSRYVKGGIEVWDVERAFQAHPEAGIPHFVEHLRFAAVEYLLRCWDKNGVADLEKAEFVIHRAIEEMKAAVDRNGRMGGANN